jgi:subtilisin family serine protease
MSRSPRTMICRVAVALCALAPALPTGTAARHGASDGERPNEVVVKLTSAADLPAVAIEYGLDPTPLSSLAGFAVYRLRIVSGESPGDLSERLVEDPAARVVYAEPNQLGQTPEGRARIVWAGTGTPSQYQGQWGGPVVSLSQAQSVTRGAGQVVAVIDTGVDSSHPALAGRILPGYDFVDNDTDPSEEGTPVVDPLFGHGTHVAGIVALVAPDAQIMPVRVLTPDGFGEEWVIAEAIRYAADPDGDPATDDGADVINLSLTSLAKSRLVRDVINQVTSAECVHSSPDDLPCLFPEGEGPVIVAAAGNSADDRPEYPAGDGRDGTISVGASTQRDRLAQFSNYGSWVDVLAPGDGILSSIPGGGYASWSGTSMAAPFVAGEAALVRAVYPSLSCEDVVRRLIRTSDSISGQVRRRIDVAAAVR